MSASEILGTYVAIKDVERKAFDHYFDTLISNRANSSDWLALHQSDVARSRNLNQAEPTLYATRDEYKEKVRQDFDQARNLVRQYLNAGLEKLGTESYSHEAAAELFRRLHLPQPTAISPERMASVVSVLPILHDTTRDIGTAATLVPIIDADNRSISIPGVLLTSAFNITLTQISRFLVRRTFDQTRPITNGFAQPVLTIDEMGSLYFRPEIGSRPQLQRDARALLHLLGIWVLGEPFPTPPVDQSLLDLASLDTREGERLINYVTLFHKSGWCLFEALHEFGHILAGDWLKQIDDLTPAAELKADQFALACLLQENDELARVLGLRGVCSFLKLLGFVEQRFGRTPRHPDAWTRAVTIEQSVLLSGILDFSDATLFAQTSELDLLATFCHSPADFGLSANDFLGR